MDDPFPRRVSLATDRSCPGANRNNREPLCTLFAFVKLFNHEVSIDETRQFDSHSHHTWQVRRRRPQIDHFPVERHVKGVVLGENTSRHAENKREKEGSSHMAILSFRYGFRCPMTSVPKIGIVPTVKQSFKNVISFVG